MIGSDILTLFPSSQTLLGKQVSELVGDDLKVKKDGSVVGTLTQPLMALGTTATPWDNLFQTV